MANKALNIMVQKKKTAFVSHNSGQVEWYTPPEYIDAAKKVMGSIDLDPASCEKANELVQAKKFYSKDEDGLKQKWTGNIWLNPPYARGLIGQFSEAVVKKFQLKDVSQAIVLVNNATETKWFQGLAGACSAICFVKGRIKFLDSESNKPGSPLQGQAIMYFGDQPNRFDEFFSNFGVILWKTVGRQ
jgi:ParB family chromosome partitioning protein